MLRQEGADVGAERSAGEVLRLGEGRRGERKEVEEIGGDSLLGPFQALPSADDHDGGGDRRVVQRERRVR